MGNKYPVPLSKVGKAVGKSPSHISKILNGRPCRMSLGEKIAEAMNMTFDEWFDTYQKTRKAS